MTRQQDKYVLIEPEQEKASACIIFCHGLGADGHDFAGAVPELNLASKNIRFIFPHAPFIPVSINGGMVMRAWYDIKNINLLKEIDMQGLEKSANYLEKILETEINSGINSKKIILAGFSQGGALALYYGLKTKYEIGGIIALSTYLPIVEKINSYNSIPIFYGHGTSDPIVPIEFAEKSKQILLDMGQKVDWKQYPIMHNVSNQELNDLGNWINAIFMS